MRPTPTEPQHSPQWDPPTIHRAARLTGSSCDESEWLPFPPARNVPSRKPMRPATLALILVGVALLLAAGGIVAVGVALDGGTPSVVAPTKTALEDAKEQCAYDSTGVTIGDDGHTMTIDRAAAEIGENATYREVTCILTSLDTPDAVIAQIEGTRALDGRQQADWGDGKFRASWTYHPEDGLDMIIEEG